MTSEEQPPNHLRLNPFRSTAVAKVSDSESGSVTVVTPAVREAQAYLDDYLRASERQVDDEGRVLAIVGDHGTGKTHLSLQLLRQAARRPRCQTMYLDATAENFVVLYQRFMERIKLDEVVERVRDRYVDLVVDELPFLDDARRADIREELRTGRLEPERLASEAALTESRLRRSLQAQLVTVTGNTQFGIALALLLREEFQGPAWEWLSGREPDPVLRERGIEEQIGSESAALEAMGVFALLYGRSGYRFVLVVDELDKALIAANRPTTEVTESFGRMLEVFAASGAFLIIAGADDVLPIFDRTERGRIDYVVHTAEISVEDTIRLVKAVQQEVLNEDRLEPFTPQTIAYLVSLASGRIRNVLTLCYQSYQLASQRGVLVTEAMIREAARVGVGFPPRAAMRAEIRRLLNAEGRSNLQDFLVTPELSVDFWIPIGADGAGCAIIVTDTVLDTDTETIRRAAETVRTTMTLSKTVLVVNGYISDASARELRSWSDVEPLVYAPRSFVEDLRAVVQAVVGSLQAVVLEAPPTLVRDADDELMAQQASALDRMIKQQSSALERVTNQQTNANGFINQVAVQVNTLQISTDRKLDAINRQLGALTRALAERADEVGVPDSSMPREVSLVFSDALNALEPINRLDSRLQETFIRQDDPPQIADRRRALRIRFRDSRAHQVIGVAFFLRELVEAFREGVRDWYRVREEMGPVSQADEAALDDLCRSYQAIYTYLPMHELERLHELTTASADQPVLSPARPAGQQPIREIFDRLVTRVKAAARRSGVDPSLAG